MSDEVFNWLVDFGIISDFLPLIALLIILKKVHRKLWWTFFFISTFWIASDCLSVIFAHYSMNNFIIYNIYALVSTFVYLYLFIQLSENSIYRRLIWVICLIYELASVAALFYFNGWYSPAPIIDIFTGILPLIFSLLFFYDLFRSLRVPNLLAYPYYWINSAIMLHFGASFFAYVFLTVFYKNIVVLPYIWLIVLVSNIIYNILFVRGLWLMKRT
jgi:hypothetical protein